MKKLALSTALLLAAGLTSVAQAHPQHSGYLTESVDSHVATGFGGCWKIGNWNPSKEEAHCGGKVEEPAPVAEVKPEPAPAPAPAPVEPPKPQFTMQAVERAHIVYFDFDSSRVTDVSEILDTISNLSELQDITLTGHTDLKGSNDYNERLAIKRVEAVAAALREGGVAADKIQTGARGETQPARVCAESGDNKSCLAANRRVEVTINGERRVQVQ